MLDGIPLSLLNGFGVVGLSLFFALMVISDRLVWHTRLAAAETDRDRWQGIALRALGVAEKMTVHAEATTEVLTKIPSPQSPDAGVLPEGP